MQDRTHVIISPTVQIIFYVIAYEIGNHIAHEMDLVYSRGVAWGLSARYFMIKYMIIVIILTVLNTVFKRKAILFSAIGSIVFGYIVFPVLNDEPYLGGLVIVVGMIGMFLSCLFFNKKFIPSS